MNSASSANPGKRGAALLIVLAFVVILSGLVVAYLSRTSTDRQLAHGTFNENRADTLARGALDTVIGDLKQEIIGGSTAAKDNSGGIIYIPSSPWNAVPQRSGNPPLVAGVDPVPNLIRRSVYPDAIAVPSRASAVNSTSAALNSRAITPTGWNSHYLIPKINTSDDSVPVNDINNFEPDWVIVTRNGPASFSSWDAALKDSSGANLSYAIGRYAYAIYDEGGLLDINIAGFPTNPAAPAVTDTGRKGIITFADLTALPTTPSASYVTNTVIDRIVGWRNYQTMQLSGSFPSGFIFTATTAANFVNYFLGPAPRTGTSANFGLVASAPVGATTGDQGFLTRKELIKLRSDTGAGAASMLQYLATFSREQNSPTWRYNSFLPSTDYPLPTRFALSNLATVTPGATGIQATFGLIWPVGRDHWQYVGTSGIGVQPSITPPVAGTPADFFQILSFARTSATGIAPPIAETLSIGASIIDQYDSDSVTTKIEYQGSDTNPAYAYGMESAVPPNPVDAPASAPAGSMLNRPFRNVGEFGYAYKNSNPSTTLDFRTLNGTNVDAGLLDFFTYNIATPRSGSVNLNTRNVPVLTAILTGALPTQTSTTGVSRAQAATAANAIVAETRNIAPGHGPAQYRADVTRLAAVQTGLPFRIDEENRESIARALAEVGQTRTWGLLIDLVAQSGRYPPTATAITQFVVEGEKRYWLHVAIDRFTGEVIDQQLEAVYE
jgi:type II secretory pathway component PulK